jgi:hypothetical protein
MMHFLSAATVLVIAGTAPAGGGGASAELTTIMYVVEGDGCSASIAWPLVLAAGSEDAAALMNQALSYEAVNGESIEQTLANYSEFQRGITGASYVVNMNEAGILDITLSVDFLGAYPSTFDYYVNLDTVTGFRLTRDDLFDIGLQDDLANLLDGMLRERIDEAIRIYCEGADEDAWMYQGYSFTEENLGALSMGPDGVVFHYDFGFPHVAAATEPDGELFLDYDTLEPYLAEGSPLLALAAY